MLARRTLLQCVAGAVVVPIRRVGLLARAQVPAGLTPDQEATLLALAEVGLPSSLSADDRAGVVRRFATWVRNYREGADMGHGYGSSNLRRPSGPSPARDYPAQFETLDAMAAASGAASFAALAPADRRAVVERALNEPTRVTRLPSSPAGDNVVADFLGFYFNSPDGWDVAYQAEIRADRCRSLDGSDRPPAPLGGG